MQSRFTLTDYLQRVVGEDFKLELTLTSLTHIVFMHLKRVRYQNTAIFSEGYKPVSDRTIPDLDVDRLYQQLILNDTPGYCFQNLELLYNVLTEAGFAVNRHTAAVTLKPLAEIENKEFIPSHELLTVKLDGIDYLVDTGFANNSLRAPIKLEAGIHAIGNDLYQLSLAENVWSLEAMIPGKDWLCFYQFHSQPRTCEEIAEANKQLFTMEQTLPIRDNYFKAALVTDTKRKAVVFFKSSGEGFYKSFRSDGTCKEKPIDSMEDAKTMAARKFGVVKR